MKVPQPDAQVGIDGGTSYRLSMIRLSIDGALDRARQLSARPGRVMLGLVGCPGTGKSTVAERIAAVTGAVVVPMDGFHLANSELVRLGLRDRKGAPETFDADGYVALLSRLRHPTGGPVYAPAFDRRIGESVAGSIAVSLSATFVVTEGNYLLHWPEARQHLDEVWYVEVDDALRLERLIARHVEFGKSPDAAREWVMRSDEANAVIVRAT